MRALVKVGENIYMRALVKKRMMASPSPFLLHGGLEAHLHLPLSSLVHLHSQIQTLTLTLTWVAPYLLRQQSAMKHLFFPIMWCGAHLRSRGNKTTDLRTSNWFKQEQKLLEIKLSF